jgi:ferredoxin
MEHHFDKQMPANWSVALRHHSTSVNRGTCVSDQPTLNVTKMGVAPEPRERTASKKHVAHKTQLDGTCIDCDLCRQLAPATFRREDEFGRSFVFQQPASEEERVRAREALESCPTDTIGDDGAEA